MLGEVVVALRRTPGDRAEDAPFLLERHLEVPFLQLSRAVDNLDPSSREHGPRVAGAERRKRHYARRNAARDAAKGQIAVDAQAGDQILRPQRFVGHGVDRRAQLFDPRRFKTETGRLRVAAETDQQARAALERAEHVELGDAPARPVRDVAVDRQHDRGPMKRIDEFRGDDSDDATVPAVAGHDQHRSRPDARVRLNNLPGSRDDRGFLFLSAGVLAVELQRERARQVPHRLVVRQEQPRRNVGRAHPAGRIHAGRQDEGDVIAVDGLAAQPAHLDERPQPDLVGSARQQIEADLRDDPVLADERHDVGERPDGGELDEAREPAVAVRAPAERLHELQRDADAGQVLVRIGAVVSLGVDDGQRRR